MINVLVVFQYGKGFVICKGGATEGDEEADAVDRFIDDAGGSGTSGDFSLEAAGVDHADLADGVWMGQLRLVDDGPGDYPGTREYALQLHDERRCTPEEWAAFLAGDWPWNEA